MIYLNIKSEHKEEEDHQRYCGTVQMAEVLIRPSEAHIA